jgi:hypothetical protein
MAVIHYSLKPKKPKPLPTYIRLDIEAQGKECPPDDGYTLGVFESYRDAQWYRVSTNAVESYDIIAIVMCESLGRILQNCDADCVCNSNEGLSSGAWKWK